jgi:hypothetical protein
LKINDPPLVSLNKRLAKIHPAKHDPMDHCHKAEGRSPGKAKGRANIQQHHPAKHNDWKQHHNGDWFEFTNVRCESKAE